MKRGVLLALVAVLALAACGGATRPPAAAKPPRIPRALAQAWEAEASSVARSLAAGDGCTAERQAAALRDSVAQAQSRVPRRLRTMLTGVVEQLPSRITCNPPAPTPESKPPKAKPPHPPHDHKHGHGHDQGDQG